jgi:hypothetical protein
VGLGREHLHLRPVVWELSTTVEANNVCPGYGRCCDAAAQFAAHGNGEAVPFVPTTENQIEQTHKRSSVEAMILAARRDFRPSPLGKTWLLSGRFTPVGLTAPALPVPTASAKQEDNHDDNQNRFQAHIEVLREKVSQDEA